MGFAHRHSHKRTVGIETVEVDQKKIGFTKWKFEPILIFIKEDVMSVSDMQMTSKAGLHSEEMGCTRRQETDRRKWP